MLNEDFLRDFFHMPPRKKPEPAPAPQPRTITINCQHTDPLEVRAANIVEMIGFSRSGSGFSVPMINGAEATLRVLKVLRKYEEQDHDK